MDDVFYLKLIVLVDSILIFALLCLAKTAHDNFVVISELLEFIFDQVSNDKR